MLVMLMGAGLDSAIADPLDTEQNECIRIVEQRDDEHAAGQARRGAATTPSAAMEELDPALVDTDDPDQVDVYKTYRMLQNKVIYADSYLRI